MDRSTLSFADNYSTVIANASGIGKNHNSYEPSFWNCESLRKIAPVLLVMVATLIGNLVLIVSLMHQRRRRRKRVNVFIVNLAIADLTVALITMTSELFEVVFKQWVLGAFLCKVLLYLQVVTLSSTTFLLTGMSIDRYQMIVQPLKSLAQRPQIKAKVVVAWTMAFVVSIPQVFIFVQVEKFSESLQETVYYCKSAGYSDEWQRKFYFTFQTFYILLLPAGIMLYCYTAIANIIWKRGGKSNNEVFSPHTNHAGSPRMSIKRNVISASRRKVVFMTLSVIIAYIVCLTPYFIISLIRIYSNYSLDLKGPLTVSQTIFMLHSALNPILYGLFALRRCHISSVFNSCERNQQHNRANVRSNKNKNKTPLAKTLRRGIICFRRGNAKEASVIIANHAAKEESSFKLRTREHGKYNMSHRYDHYILNNVSFLNVNRQAIQKSCSVESVTLSSDT